MKKLVVSSMFWGAVFGVVFIALASLISEVDSRGWQGVLYGVSLEVTIQALGVSSKRCGYKPLESGGYWLGFLATGASGAAVILTADAALPAGVPAFPESISLGWVFFGAICTVLAWTLIVWTYESARERGKVA